MPADLGTSLSLKYSKFGVNNDMGKNLIINEKTKLRFIYDSEAFSGVLKVSEMVKKDIQLVTGASCSSMCLTDESELEASEEYEADIIFGTIGKSPVLDSLSKKGTINYDQIIGKREVYGFFPILEEDRKLIVIAGSDKRGTIYGLFHISDLLGVSPLVNWSLVVTKKGTLEITPENLFVSKEPSVTYRGFFINDEWPAFGNWCMKHFGGVNCKAYEGIFEMLLRMKGNYLWPAMWASCFAEDGPGLESALLADELGVVMGLSHHEPCLRHGEEYSHVRGKDSIYGDAWNFCTNKEGITRFWRDGLKRNGHLENVITVGMRGERDSTILGRNATLKDNIDLLRDVLKTQNQLISEEVNPDLDKVPRMLALYKEVEPFYYGTDDVEGLQNSSDLDNVILMLCDDNHGYVRSLPDEEMRKHKGGFGMYYHFDYHGEPVSYEWINSTYLPEVWEQMTVSYEHGIRELWIVNVGDLGLQEMPLSYFLSLAYDYDKYGIASPNSTLNYLRGWMNLQFGSAFETADIDLLTDAYNRYTRLVHNRRPEHLNDSIYHPQNFYEAERILEEVAYIKDTVKELESRCPEESKAAFTELISYNVLAGMNLIEMWIFRAYNHYFASVGALVANDYGDKVRLSMERDVELAERLHSAADRKWDGFGMAQHIGFRNWNSEEAVMPVIETVYPVNRPELVIGLTGQTGSTRGLDWTKKKLVCDIWKTVEETEDTQLLQTRIFVALTGNEEIEYKVSLTVNNEEISADDGCIVSDKYKLRIDKTSGLISPSNPLEYITVTAPESVLQNLSPEDEIHLYVSYPQARADIQLCGIRKDILVIEADEFSKYGNVPEERKDSFLILKDIGRRENAVKQFPVTENVLLTENTPYLEYEFTVREAGEYNIIFQMLPTNSYTFGENIFLKFSVNSDSISDVRDIEIKLDKYTDGVANAWWKGVMDHVRYATPKTSFYLNEGVNKLRFYAASRENVLERIILHKADREIPQSYLGPV